MAGWRSGVNRGPMTAIRLEERKLFKWRATTWWRSIADVC
jgi:hypothetical protein